MERLPEGYTARPITMDDTDDVAALVNAYLASNGSAERFSPERLRGQLSIPGFDVESATQVVASPEGNLVAAGLVIDVTEPHVSHGLGGQRRAAARAAIEHYLAVFGRASDTATLESRQYFELEQAAGHDDRAGNVTTLILGRLPNVDQYGSFGTPAVNVAHRALIDGCFRFCNNVGR